ncbi:UDP binding domain-containing protein [Streptomyces sp. NPDC048445]|uniref:UDP binding domain-containing protein n=1 Tax=Streptomyces sp. NPDC048445 TaxID=3365553 RepID=UPI00371D03BF
MSRLSDLLCTPGVGGHCIPIDPNYLSHKVRALGYPFRFVELAQEINGRMPVYVADRVMHLLNDDGLALRGSRVLLLGVTYKADVADQRESPSLVVAERLLALGARVSYHDPFIPEWDVAGERLFSVPDLDTALTEAAVTVILQTHCHYDLDVVAKYAQRVLDTCGRAGGANVTRL